MVFNLSIRIKENTTRGKLLKALFKEDRIDTSDKPLTVTNLCRNCNKSPNSKDKINCAICNEDYHISCLTQPFPTDCLILQATNPCLWWFCARCMVDSEKPDPDTETKVTTVDKGDTKTDNQALFSNITSMLDNFKSDLLLSVDEKLAPLLYNCENVPNNNVNPDSQTASQQCHDHPDNSSWAQVAGRRLPVCDNTKTISISTKSQSAYPKDTDMTSEVLVLSPSLSQQENEHTNSVDESVLVKVKKTVKTTLTKAKTRVNFVEDNKKNGKIYIGFPDNNCREEGARIVNKSNEIKSLGYSSKNASKMLPKILINNVDGDKLSDIDMNIPAAERQKLELNK